MAYTDTTHALCFTRARAADACKCDLSMYLEYFKYVHVCVTRTVLFMQCAHCHSEGVLQPLLYEGYQIRRVIVASYYLLKHCLPIW
jgi:hypothetical protein